MYSNTGVPYRYIEQIVRQHEKQLENSLRYERFVVDETVQDWRMLLGDDVIALTHPYRTAKVAEKCIKSDMENHLKLSKKEQLLLYTACYVHDFGELFIGHEGVGDITFEKHNSDHMNIEKDIFSKLLATLADNPQKSLIKSAYYDVVMKKTTKVGAVFDIVERIGYLETGLRAFVGVAGKRIKNWKGLTGNVLSNQIKPLLAYSEKYPFIGRLLKKYQKTITSAFKETISGDVPQDKNNEKSFDSQKLQMNYESWKTSAFFGG
ncbi:MAG: HD domain-containing protein [Patescibacteria group bacterium]